MTPSMLMLAILPPMSSTPSTAFMLETLRPFGAVLLVRSRRLATMFCRIILRLAGLDFRMDPGRSRCEPQHHQLHHRRSVQRPAQRQFRDVT